MEDSTQAELLIPDILTSAQYYDGLRRDNPETQAIKRLMLAVLVDAVRCFQTYADARGRAGRRMFSDAERWILDRKSDGPFAFQALCETLGIEPDRLRDGLLKWRVQRSGGMNLRGLGRRAPVRRAGPIGSSRCRQPRKRNGGISRGDAMAAPSIVVHAARRDNPDENSASSEIFYQDLTFPSLALDSASDASC
jgi:hypothetical protein